MEWLGGIYNEEENMELKDLVGEHMLDAVDFSNEQVKTWGDEFEACQVMRFRLDGKVYTATEDPSDGYRSSMNEITVGDWPMALDSQYKKAKSASEMVRAKPAVVLIQDPRTGKTHQAVKRADLQAAGVKVAEPAKGQPESYAAREAQRKEEHRKAMARADAENERRLALLLRVRERMAATERSAFDLRLVAHAAIEGVEWADWPMLNKLWGVAGQQQLAQRIDSLELPELTQLVLDCGLVRDVHASEYDHDKPPKVLHAVAAHYGVEVAT